MERSKDYYLQMVHGYRKELWDKLGLTFTKSNFYEIHTEASNQTYQLFRKISDALAARADGVKASNIINKDYRLVLDAYVPAHKQEEALSYIDKYNRLCYSAGLGRRTVHSEKRKRIPGTELEQLFDSYYNLALYCDSMEDFVQGRLRYEAAEMEQALDYYTVPRISRQDDLIAAELDAGGNGLPIVLEDIILSENNTNAVTVPMIRGIVKSDQECLHQVLGRFLLAARLQEGIRQAICENADCGTKDAFLSILQVIVENGLNRYSAVKRAVAAWTGICSEEHLERISDKLLTLIDRALREQDYRKEILKSNDSMELYIGLWAVGFYEAADTVELVCGMIKNGTRNQKLTASYYNLSLYDQEFAKQGARYVLETWPEDVELAAAYFPSYLPDTGRLINRALYGKRKQEDYYYYGSNRTYVYEPIAPEELFDTRSQAERHYGLLKRLYDAVPKKGCLFSPCIFPWYSVSLGRSDILVRLCLIAYALGDTEKLDEMSLLLPEVSADIRARLVRLLLHDPKTKLMREALLQAVADKESDTRKDAFEITKELVLTGEDYRILAGELKFKAGDIRMNVLNLLEKQPDEDLYSCVELLLSSKKEEMRAGGLDLIVRMKKKEAKKDLFGRCAALALKLPEPTQKEQIIIRELGGGTEADEVLNLPGYGLYDPAVTCEFPEWKADPAAFRNVFAYTQEQMYEAIKGLDDLIEKNKDLEYKSAYGEECLLGNEYSVISYEEAFDSLDRYPFADLFRGFYRDEIKDLNLLISLYVFLNGYVGDYQYRRIAPFKTMAEKLCGKEIWGIDLRNCIRPNIVYQVIQRLFYEEVKKQKGRLRQVSLSMIAGVLTLPVEETRYTVDRYVSYGLNEFFGYFLTLAKNFSDDEEFRESFLMCLAVNRFYDTNLTDIRFDWFVKAYTLGMMPLDPVYQMLFEHHTLTDFFDRTKLLVSARPKEGGLSLFSMKDVAIEDNPVFKTAQQMYWKIVELILKVEPKRSEAATPFSYAVGRIYRIRGMKYFVEILTALGSDTFDRQVYYRYNFGSSRKECLSALLYASEPLPGEDGALLKKLLKGRGISERRLIEAAMYAPAWIDAVEECLGFDGLKSGIYYFSAHMNESFDDRKTAVIAKYTPLGKDDLIAGAFDIKWFGEVLNKLGEKRFQLLYDSAKYISDGNKHTRARKYADAAQGKVTAAELKVQIAGKRNKDLLMSYPLVPIKDEKDLLERYTYIQQFLKESKQFGAQRKASEGLAAKMAMINLAAASGYEDVTRLILNMETKLAEVMGSGFEWQSAGDAELKIEVDETGKADLKCRKDGKILKSVPSRLAKNETVLELKETVRQLREQYRRTRQMLEQFMEEETILTGTELFGLLKNPVVRPVASGLVYLYKDKFGFPEARTLVSASGETTRLTPAAKLKIAHPYHLWKAGVWLDYQKDLFEKAAKQPFKQVFRELYLKTEEELDRGDSLRYAGNQIQPSKTAACLKTRRWVADYEDGLQKVYYKENIVARIYAQADWFSPADIEAPTLEWVSFADRQTYKPVKIKDVPEILFSEVMRDVDLAVSVAHAGGVDPETSHSTMEMRKAIIENNLPLFGLTNVTFAGSHALIKGKRADYTVHLGSGIIFRQGGAQIAVLPVHSQHRGKIFLPFIDEDPKTAEIMSKIVLFAQDETIKDPYILDQIKRG